MLYEAEFHDKKYTKMHYDKHVLSQGEKNKHGKNLRFPYMSIEDYKKEAKLLSEEPCGLSTSNDPIIGFVHDTTGDNRFYKIRLQSKFDTRYMDIVSYTDDPDWIYTFFMARKNRLNNYLSHFVDELPENKK